MGNWTKDLRWWRACYVIYYFEGLGAVINITVVVLVGASCIKSPRAVLSITALAFYSTDSVISLQSTIFRCGYDDK